MGVIEIEIDNEAFNANSVKQILDKWGYVYENDWDIEVIASSEF